jgi:hypothetical protein
MSRESIARIPTVHPEYLLPDEPDECERIEAQLASLPSDELRYLSRAIERLLDSRLPEYLRPQPTPVYGADWGAMDDEDTDDFLASVLDY